MEWLASRPVASLFTSAITQAEILFGIALLAAGKRRDAFEAAVAAMFAEDFAGRILAFDQDAAPAFAGIAAVRRRLGTPISQPDAQIAAICLVHGATLATRNMRDFANCGIETIDPWS